MKLNKFFYLYLAGGTLALLLLLYQTIGKYPNISISSVFGDVLLTIVLYYMAYKVYHEKNDGEMM